MRHIHFIMDFMYKNPYNTYNRCYKSVHWPCKTPAVFAKLENISEKTFSMDEGISGFLAFDILSPLSLLISKGKQMNIARFVGLIMWKTVWVLIYPCKRKAILKSETYCSYGQIFECVSVVVCIDGRYKFKYIYLRNYSVVSLYLGRFLDGSRATSLRSKKLPATGKSASVIAPLSPRSRCRLPCREYGIISFFWNLACHSPRHEWDPAHRRSVTKILRS